MASCYYQPPIYGSFMLVHEQIQVSDFNNNIEVQKYRILWIIIMRLYWVYT